MELALNLEWMALAIAMLWLWIRHARLEGPGRTAQFVSLVLVLFTMFVVITMYDDMTMAQNPAEMRCFQREDDSGAHHHAALHPVVTSTPPLGVKIPLGLSRLGVPGSIVILGAKVHVFSSIQNRPPPAV